MERRKKIASRSAKKSYSKSPLRNEKQKVNNDINHITVINPENIESVRNFLKEITTKSSTLESKKISAIKNAESLKVLKDSGFFSKIFFNQILTFLKIKQKQLSSKFLNKKLKKFLDLLIKIIKEGKLLYHNLKKR